MVEFRMQMQLPANEDAHRFAEKYRTRINMAIADIAEALIYVLACPPSLLQDAIKTDAQLTDMSDSDIDSAVRLRFREQMAYLASAIFDWHQLQKETLAQDGAIPVVMGITEISMHRVVLGVEPVAASDSEPAPNPEPPEQEPPSSAPAPDKSEE